MLFIFLLAFNICFAQNNSQNKPLQEGELLAKVVTSETNSNNEIILTAKDSVSIKTKNLTLNTELAEFNTTTKFLNIPVESKIMHTENGQKSFIFSKKISGFPSEKKLEAKDVTFVSNLASLSSAFAKTEENTINLQNAKFSTCKMLNPETQEPCPMPWFATAKKITFNNETKILKAKHFVLRIHSVPVFYTPYLRLNLNAEKSGWQSVNLLTANNQQGFEADYLLLAKEFGKFNIRPQIYFSQNTQNPLNSRGNNIAVLHTYSKKKNLKTVNSESEIKVAPNVASETKNSTTRYYLQHKGASFDDTITLQTNLNIASDKSFRQIYNFTFENYLESNVSYTKLREKSFTNINSKHYEPITLQQSATIPTVISSAQHNQRIEKKLLNFNTEANLQALQFYRADGISGVRNTVFLDSSRIIKNEYFDVELNPNVTLSHYTYTGELRPQTQAIQSISDVNATLSKSLLYNIKGFTFQAKPMFFIDYTTSTQNGVIVNEDSVANYISDSNVFSKTQYNGIDAVEKGLKMAYGLEFVSKNIAGNQYKFLIAQRYNNDENLSNYVGNFSFQSNNMSGKSRFIFSQEDGSTLFSNTRIKANLNKSFEVSLGYIYIDKSLQTNFQSTSQFNPVFNQNLTLQTIQNIEYGIKLKHRKNNVFLNVIQNPQFLEADGKKTDRIVMFSTGFGYETDCLKYTIGIQRRLFIRGDEIINNNTFIFEFKLFG